jgi:hypothetical protein
VEKLVDKSVVSLFPPFHSANKQKQKINNLIFKILVQSSS